MIICKIAMFEQLDVIVNSFLKISNTAYNSNILLCDKSGVALFLFYMYKLAPRSAESATTSATFFSLRTSALPTKDKFSTFER